ncbi:MAG TPA: monovalent cation/H+ antiporter complex subunit F [Jatrophihabitans sp.]|nr:monovalent cation/H+ antiporter complex subunit F [Jatrophihabitans sp.]
MSMWLVASLALLIGAFAPAVYVGARGGPVDRLAGLQQLGGVAVLVLMLFAQAVDRSDYLIVPLVLVLVSFAGALVFTRLLIPRK